MLQAGLNYYAIPSSAMSIRIRVNASAVAEEAACDAGFCWLLIPRSGVDNVAALVQYCVKQLELQSDASSIRVFLDGGFVPHHQPADILRDGDAIILRRDTSHGHQLKPATGAVQQHVGAVVSDSQANAVGVKRMRQELQGEVTRTTQRRRSRAQSITSSSSSCSSDSEEESASRAELLTACESAQPGSTGVDATLHASAPIQNWKKTRRGKRSGKKHRKSGAPICALAENPQGSPDTRLSVQPICLHTPLESPASQFVSLEGDWSHLACDSSLAEQLNAGDIICYTALCLSARWTPELSAEVIARIESVGDDHSDYTVRVIEVAGPLLGIANTTATLVERSGIMSCKKLIPPQPVKLLPAATATYTPTSPLGPVPSSSEKAHHSLTDLNIAQSTVLVEQSNALARTSPEATRVSTFTSSNKREVRNHILKRRLGVGSLLAALNKPTNA
jgi:hypothetical protein